MRIKLSVERKINLRGIMEIYVFKNRLNIKFIIEFRII